MSKPCCPECHALLHAHAHGKETYICPLCGGMVLFFPQRDELLYIPHPSTQGYSLALAAS